MTLADFLATWRGLTLENRLHRLAVLGLIGTNLLTAVALLRAERTVVLVPPLLEGQVSVARAAASQEVKEAWALFVAELLGNVSPAGAEFLERALDPLLAPSLRRSVLEVLAEQVREIQRERVSMRFTVRELLYDPASDTVFVTGIQTTTGPGGKPVARPRTYEVVVGFQNYRPVIRHLDVYPEEPRVGDKAKTPNIP
ncbi:MAG: type IV conjugative transfer system protein TraE [Chromatiaceae bacterium]|jgi:conjugal transfer pilus assembly protein TraE|nr:type IV conjugative transfer system protein TraE [Chromatiaceae bacterium]